MNTHSARAQQFAALHRQDAVPLLLPNAYDRGTARVLAHLGFSALATTSAGHAATLGSLDGFVDRDEALAHFAAIVEATELPVSADFENGFARDPEGLAENVAMAVSTGLAGCSVEDYSGPADDAIYDVGLAAERVSAAVEAAHRVEGLVLTARAENHIHGRSDLADTIARLQAFQAAGADVLYAPGLTDSADIESVVTSVDRPVNVLAMPGVPPVGELASLGVKRISVGGAFSMVAIAAVSDAARELLESGTYGYWERARAGRGIARASFADRG